MRLPGWNIRGRFEHANMLIKPVVINILRKVFPYCQVPKTGCRLHRCRLPLI